MLLWYLNLAGSRRTLGASVSVYKPGDRVQILIWSWRLSFSILIPGALRCTQPFIKLSTSVFLVHMDNLETKGDWSSDWPCHLSSYQKSMLCGALPSYSPCVVYIAWVSQKLFFSFGLLFLDPIQTVKELPV